MSRRTKKNSPQKNRDLSRSEQSMPGARNLHVLAGIALIIGVAFLAYLPSLKGEFVFDDDLVLTDNPLIKSSDGWRQFWTAIEKQVFPITNLTLWIEWRLWGIRPTGYHVTNLILHIIEALLIWLILRKLSIPGAFWAALIFTIHPVNVESVAWIAQRKGMMAMLFFLLSILCYLKFVIPQPANAGRSPAGHYPPPTVQRQLFYWLSLAIFVVGMFSKGSIAVLPILLLGIIWWRRKLTGKDIVRTMPFFLVAVVLTGVNMWFQSHYGEEAVRPVGFSERLLGAGGVVCFYLYKALLPLNLVFIYPQWQIKVDNPLWWLPLLMTAVVTAVLCWRRRTWGRPFLFAWGYFCVSLIPVLGFTDVGFMQYTLVCDHYQHLAIIGMIALAAAGYATWRESVRASVRWTSLGVAMMVLGVLTFLTWRQSGLYSNPITLYQATLEKNPTCWNAHYNLGHALVQSHRLPEAIEHFRQTLRLNPNFPEALNNLGFALANTGKVSEAIENYQQALRLRPDYPEAHDNMGIALDKVGRGEEAIEHFQQALRLRPGNAEFHNNLGLTLANLGRLPEAIEHYNQALRIKPNYPEAHSDLGNALIQTGNTPEAIVHYRQAIQSNPDFLQAYFNLGMALFHTGRPQEAVDNFHQFLRLKPNDIEANFDLALIYANLQQSSQAIAAAQKALEIARSQGQSEQVKKIEDWLNTYSAQNSEK